LKGRVLIVAGSDSGGGAGIQADIKTITALGGYAATAITALTAQDTLNVHEVVPVDAAFVRRQMQVVLDDIGADAIKLGMLHDKACIEAVCGILENAAREIPVVTDPVMVAKGGARLLSEEAVDTLKIRLLPLSRLVTPNIPEAEAIAGVAVRDDAGRRAAAERILELGPGAVLVKGGHLEGETVSDLLVSAQGSRVFEHPRIDTTSTHGTGCTLASAIAAGIAGGLGLEASVAAGIDYVHEAIRRAPGFGAGHGPLDHTHTIAVTSPS